jgi:putative PEP-CTERM system TPR-repeat lipoprotein
MPFSLQQILLGPRVRLLAGFLALAGLTVAGCGRDPEVRKREYVESGDAYLKNGKVQEALIEYRNAVQLDPRYAAARVKLADVYVTVGNGGGALNEYVRAADLLPDDAALQVKAGNLLLAGGQANEALSRADKALKTSPSVEGHILRGNALGGLNDLERALTEMEEAIRLAPSQGGSYTQLGMVQLARGRTTEAEQAFKTAVDLDPQSLSAHLALANFYWMAGRLPSAEESFDKALKLQPTNEGANRAMAIFSLTTGRVARAEQYLKQVVDTSKSPSAIFGLSDYYLATNRASEAITLLEAAASKDRPVPGARSRLAFAYAAAGESAKANTLADEIVKQEPQDAQAHLIRAELQMRDGRRDAALESVKAAVAAQPTSIQAHFALGKLHAARGDVTAAERAFQEVLTLNPRAAAAQVEISRLRLNTGDAKASLELAQAATATQPQNTEARLGLVRSLLATNDLARADKEIQALLAAAPNLAGAHVQRGVLAATRNDAPTARAAFEKAAALDAQSVEALAGLVALDLNSKNLAAAAKRVSDRIEQGKPTPELLLLAARTYISVNDQGRAEQALRRAIDVDPSVLQAYAMLGRLYLSQGKLEEARKGFDTLADKQASPVGALTMSGIILQGQGRTPDARARYERALALDSRAAVAANNLAWLYAEAGENMDRAVQLAETAAAVLPDVPQVLDTLGWVYHRNRLPALAVPALTRAVAKEPKNASYQYHLGLAQQQAGDLGKARQSLEKALALQPNFPEADDAKRALSTLGAGASR